MFQRLTSAINTKRISTSLIISTYNWPEALHLCLLSVAKQSVLPDEIIIADDGSGAETAILIGKARMLFSIPVVHVWQEDNGFQLAQIRNKAIARASCEYIIQIDGDLVLHTDFVKDHQEMRREGTFVTGSRVLAGPVLSAQLMKEDSTRISFFESDIKNPANLLRIRFLRHLLASRYRCRNLHSLRGCNMAFWKEDLVMVNGYNEAFQGWGREDNDIAVRLLNAGVCKRTMKFGGVALHLYHPEQSRVACEKNDTLLSDTISAGLTWSNAGMDQYIPVGSYRQSLVSVIIVTRNAASYLQRCLDSIASQRYPALEVIVLDGASTDATVDIIKANSGIVTYWKSEPDQGIYDAMNKALDVSKGEWIYFLGADDELTPDFSRLAAALRNKQTIYYGSVWKDGRKYLGKLQPYTHAKTGINHQAMIYPASVFHKYRFDTNYPISADHILNMQCWRDKDYRFAFKDYVIATFSTGGVSSLNKDHLFEQHKATFIRQNYGWVIWSRFLFKRIKEAFHLS